ncbi:hypothetical protein [Actinacidiphila acididurans]|uniref:Uncharacterized protein n=1 Tax=Actinacidiphila acididurans TaxID=2784346 RepID=A0ABS2U210_9ACTN|nr:hypothetical protein [Actinacidiphila acididurans]MBM9509236.1 hypothetical protein [Actinacidiphila acididurans]
MAVITKGRPRGDACRRTRRRPGGRVLAVAAVAGAAALLAAGPASAYSNTGTVAATAGLNARWDPNGAAGPIAGGPVVATVPYNSTVYIDCYWTDASVTGPWGATKVWDDIEGYRTPNGAYHDLSGYAGWVFVSDAWVNTGAAPGSGEPPCFGY